LEIFELVGIILPLSFSLNIIFVSSAAYL